ncbi:mortality factor 4-like protein 1 [Macrotis lagotis]|uniref:mortality factor 4-like protein 1 n=1 Tax=Macrotis lagotis TaxID=92651 RepID=UPI003D697970
MYLVRYTIENTCDTLSQSVARSYGEPEGSQASPMPEPGPSSTLSGCSYFDYSSNSRDLDLAEPGEVFDWSYCSWFPGPGAEEASTSTSTSTSTKVLSSEPRCPAAPESVYMWLQEGQVLRYITMHRQKDSDTALQAGCQGAAMGEFLGASAQGGQGEAPSSGAAEVQGPRKYKQKCRSYGSRWQWGTSKEPEHRCLGKLNEVQIHLPKALKLLLLQDCKQVTVNKKLFTLPAKKPVSTILAEYVAAQQNCTPTLEAYAVADVVATLQEFFDMVLGSQLLYQVEKLQHRKIQARYAQAPISDIHGGAHLLRLFPQLGPMLACAPLSGDSLQMLLNPLHDFLKYFASDPALLFQASTEHGAN